jgi:hypothetical protein
VEGNTTIFLFITTPNIEEDMKIDEPYCMNPTNTTLIVMKCCINEKQHHHQIQHFVVFKCKSWKIETISVSYKEKVVIKVFGFEAIDLIVASINT